MNVSLLRESKLLHGQERRGSKMSVRMPSRQPSMASLRPTSPNPSLGMLTNFVFKNSFICLVSYYQTKKCIFIVLMFLNILTCLTFTFVKNISSIYLCMHYFFLQSIASYQITFIDIVLFARV